MAIKNNTIGKPIFPITVIFHEDGEIYTFNSGNEMEYDLEWFNSKDKDVTVKDNKGRLVNLKIEALNIVTFELCNEHI
ncbi:MAG: hypothetical protein LBL65_08715 [Campylobacteraceae bacterium]|jgi:hypothetical protein|nr:hypothetical protein [Campylobacteraceae bacterium]